MGDTFNQYFYALRELNSFEMHFFKSSIFLIPHLHKLNSVTLNYILMIAP